MKITIAVAYNSDGCYSVASWSSFTDHPSSQCISDKAIDQLFELEWQDKKAGFEHFPKTCTVQFFDLEIP
jgi:hypothetical protein